MKLPSFTTLSALLLASEIALAVAKRSKSRATGKDRLTLPLLWTVIGVSIFAALFLRAAFPQGRLPHPQTFYVIGLILFLLGLIIRWIAIIHLGRFFTVNVAIADDHQLITTGPYRYVRHPSYTGTLLVFLGFGLCMLNIFSLATVFLPITVAFLWRMHVEEAALKQAFGDRYQAVHGNDTAFDPIGVLGASSQRRKIRKPLLLLSTCDNRPSLKTSCLLRTLPVCLVLLVLVQQTRAQDYNLLSPAWPAGSNVVMNLGLGTTTVALQDGSSSLDAYAADALDIWNGYVDFITPSSIASATVPEISGDGVNATFFSSTIFGDTFGDDTLAVTVYLTDEFHTAMMTEADVVCNTASK